MRPISVLVPTRNSISLLPKHIEGLRPWLDLAQEVVAVDSHSTDGTREFLERELQHPNLRVLTHPPGLYQSWNFGIAQCRAKYIYVSTVGETITRSGLEQLLATADALRADVVISPPRMVKMSGDAKDKTWPIHWLIEALDLKRPWMMAGSKAQLFAVANLRRGILGSSASNLYRADVLKRFPFRTDFGTAGDLAWGLEHAGAMRIAVLPEPISTFVFHPKSYARSDYAVADFARKCLEVARQAVQRKAWTPSHASGPDEALIEELLRAWERHLLAKETVEAEKRSALWLLKPGAWQAHAARRRALAKVEELRKAALVQLRESSI
jgi:glycosyltransferase involved in cell wall biosynthesis